MGYEFGEAQNTVILSISSMAMALAGLVALGGLTGIIDSLIDARLLRNSSATGSTAVVIIYVIQYLIQLVGGMLFIPAILALRRVATTAGSDIKELLAGLNGMGRSFHILVGLIGISIALDVVLILM